MKKKKEIKVELEEVTWIFTDIFIVDLIDKIKSLEDKYVERNYYNLIIEREYGGRDSDSEYYLYGSREETDKEYKKRMNVNKRKRENNKLIKERNKEKEVQKLKKLMEKYPEEVK